MLNEDSFSEWVRAMIPRQSREENPPAGIIEASSVTAAALRMRRWKHHLSVRWQTAGERTQWIMGNGPSESSELLSGGPAAVICRSNGWSGRQERWQPIGPLSLTRMNGFHTHSQTNLNQLLWASSRFTPNANVQIHAWMSVYYMHKYNIKSSVFCDVFNGCVKSVHLIYIYMYIYIYMCVCGVLCVCMCCVCAYCSFFVHFYNDIFTYTLVLAFYNKWQLF